IVVEQLQAVAFAGLDFRVDAEALVFADEVLNAGCHVHEFVTCDHAVGIDARAQALAEHGQHVTGKLHADLFLLIGGESVDDAVDGGGGAVGVQGGENQVSGFGGGDGGADR